MARALIVGCGCRGRSLGVRLAAEGWRVRGTTRTADRRIEIEAAGIEAAIADPESPGTVLELVGDVTVLHWLLGSARGDRRAVAAIHGPRLQRLLEKLVDSPVRGVVYEAAGSAPAESLREGARIVEEAAGRWRIPVAVVAAAPDSPERWLQEMTAATRGLVS